MLLLSISLHPMHLNAVDIFGDRSGDQSMNVNTSRTRRGGRKISQSAPFSSADSYILTSTTLFSPPFPINKKCKMSYWHKQDLM